MESIHRALLLTVPGIGSAKLRKLIEYFGDAQTVWASSLPALTSSKLLASKEIAGIVTLRNRTDGAEALNKWSRQGIYCCSMEDDAYPPLLRHIFDPPPVLFFRGQIQPGSLYFAVVGSRHSTPYGRNVARSFGEKLSRSGVTVVSGAASGIDTSAHEGALRAGAPTVAVLGCGVDIAYPRDNAALISQIAAKGCVMSEYPPGTPPLPGQFPARNRIVAGMSVGVLVVEAASKSGALLTADFAVNENRDVYAVPGSIFSESSQGTHRLIQQGARLVSSAEDLLSELGLPVFLPGRKMMANLEPEEKQVLRELSFSEPITVDALVLRLEIDASQIMVILLRLELAGYVLKDSCMGYSRVAKESE